MNKSKLIRVSTVPSSLSILLNGQLSFFNRWFHVIGVSSPGKDLETVKLREEIETKAIEIKRHISPFNDLISLWRLYLFFQKEKPLIVHSITPKAGLLSMMAAKLARVPIRMHTFTGLIFPYKTGLLQKVLIVMDKILCRCATNIYPEGIGVKTDLEQYHITRKKLKVIANGNVNGIDLAYFDPDLYTDEQKEKLKKSLFIDKDDFVFIFVGRLVRDKGINELIAAFKKLSIKYNSAKLILVGSMEAEFDPLSLETIEEIKTNSQIISVGWQSDVRSYFAISDALVFPSYREGFPNVVIQAGSMNLPSIVTDINGCNEIIVEGKNGTIIPSKDTETLYKKMELYINNPELVNKYASNSRDMIALRYEQQLVWQALLEEYQTLEKTI